jgi:hypothetical protein
VSNKETQHQGRVTAAGHLGAGRRIAASAAAVAALAAGLTGTTALLTTETASATACAPTTFVAAGSNCQLTGTLSLLAGTLTLASPASLTWAGTLNGFNLSIVDTVAADQQYTVSDGTGSGAGWHVTTAATTFTSGGNTLANSGTFSTTGSTTSASATSAPTAACAVASTCTLPTDTTTYPVAITTAASSPTPVTIYDDSANKGIGQIIIGGSSQADPVGWWLAVPATAVPGTYTSTVTMAVVSGP